jgi:hypothetical protein
MVAQTIVAIVDGHDQVWCPACIPVRLPGDVEIHESDARGCVHRCVRCGRRLGGGPLREAEQIADERDAEALTQLPAPSAPTGGTTRGVALCDWSALTRSPIRPQMNRRAPMIDDTSTARTKIARQWFRACDLEDAEELLAEMIEATRREARLEGWRAAREACARVAEVEVAVGARRIAAAIRALEPQP